MASSSKTSVPENATSSKQMDADLDAIGKHCQMEYCHTKIFLPFKCDSCRETFCDEHRTEDNHKCKRKGEAARKRTGIDPNAPLASSKPSILDQNSWPQCAAITCKTLLDPRAPKEHCTNCRRDYCLKHRFGENHDCENQRRRLIQTSSVESQKERGLNALKGLRAWASKKATAANSATVSIKQKATPKPKGVDIAAKNALKMSAKGDPKVPPEKRVYLFVEASADTTVAKFPTGKFYYSKEWTIGRVLDAAAKALQVQNVNNRVPGEEEKLRVFHVEGGKLLNFSDKVEELKDGHTIVLLRGVGPPVPDLIGL